MYQSIMWDYMKEEKELLSNLLKNEEATEKVKAMKEMDALYIVAHGSSYNAASAIAPFISKLCPIRTYVYTPSSFANNAFSLMHEDRTTTWVLGISQTGTSRGVLEALDPWKKEGFKIAGITNEKESPIDKMSDVTFYLNCGEEDSNAKTKGYSSTLLMLMKMALALAADRGCMDADKVNVIKKELETEINNLTTLQENTKAWCEKHTYGKGMEHLYVIGNGMNYATALEGMLKLMETMCIPTMFSDIEEFSHGMHRSVKENSFIILLQGSIGRVDTMKTFNFFKEKGVNVMIINAGEEMEDENVINVGETNTTDNVLSMTSVIQVISAYVPELNGFDPNREANNDYTDCVNTRV